jgi:hypothetical protein
MPEGTLCSYSRMGLYLAMWVGFINVGQIVRPDNAVRELYFKDDCRANTALK